LSQYNDQYNDSKVPNRNATVCVDKRAHHLHFSKTKMPSATPARRPRTLGSDLPAPGRAAARCQLRRDDPAVLQTQVTIMCM